MSNARLLKAFNRSIVGTDPWRGPVPQSDNAIKVPLRQPSSPAEPRQTTRVGIE
jgi:hypothetical protein